ncbi:cobalt-precorrin 5A hydrolase [Massiliimalia timonensis]|uniref:cobalt-precorrin 5A hydrolase n=1 Tax=Massiliimalia timonensis TaxID=1987501 RepID=UPI000B8A73E6|nr:cobalt-precorrin 5A hydrolase [Massiliimalia timonensis]
MKLAGIGFTETGKGLLERFSDLFGKDLDRYEINGVRQDIKTVTGLSEFARIGFEKYDGLIFVGACGIAVRAIAPFLQSKTVDPAVLVIDEQGRFVIPVASGHLGGANRLAEQTACFLGGTAVITTATDINRVFAVDSWAKEQHLWIRTPEQIKTVSAALLRGEAVGFVSEYPWCGALPPGVRETEKAQVGLCISAQQKFPFANTLLLTPRPYVLGIGCRKGISREILEEQIAKALFHADIEREMLRAVCSVDRKQDEPALVSWCREHRLPFLCYSARELSEVEGEFSSSDFVKRTVGTENVCERAAVLGSGGKLILPKFSGQGVTVAAAECEVKIKF